MRNKIRLQFTSFLFSTEFQRTHFAIQNHLTAFSCMPLLFFSPNHIRFLEWYATILLLCVEHLSEVYVCKSLTIFDLVQNSKFNLSTPQRDSYVTPDICTTNTQKSMRVRIIICGRDDKREKVFQDKFVVHGRSKSEEKV